ncbi:SH3 domain-containing protein [Candidatus Marinarcus aquaticus]|uniref:Glycoside hydrolase n=1 Tax=Candidatus Marinarcus aquaticus TaxID=2044504 RepID=A0A4Q0XRK8_9BACT|nr:SH3 domain-containing C40 family peptidase [Candidatus Marinarcus aquaticus]RXJ60127.1 hypothetical protein CRV04_03750 [Candidatus Marinarcus aquaticus]
MTSMVQSSKHKKVVSLGHHKLFFSTLLSFSILFFSACSNKVSSINDLQTLPQNALAYEFTLKTQTAQNTQHNLTLFKERFFGPWNQKQLSISQKKASWGEIYMTQKVYGLNHQLLSKKWFKKLNDNANWAQYNHLKADAVVIKNSNLRVFPSTLPIFYNPKKAGEGFPFDYNQNSGIKINTPILISHYSTDKQWVFVESGFAFGWIKTSDIALVNERIKTTYLESTLYIAIKDNFPIYKNSMFIEQIKLGTIFPKSRQGNFFVFNHYHNLEGYIQTIQNPKEKLHTLPLPFTKEKVQHVVNELIQEPYGWGEAFSKRDCSALTKDFFALFGLYLNRNSKQQTRNGEYISLKELSNQEKKEQIKSLSEPFSTLIYLPGHIMIYAGIKDNEPLVFHNFWGIKTENLFNEKGRFVVGQAAITTLEPGKELPNYAPQSNILSKIKGMVILHP